jgi:hypothetical protein
MNIFKTKVDSSESEEEYLFICYDNKTPIEIGDYFIFFFGGIADVQKCMDENMRYEINENDRVSDPNVIDFVTGFWRNCYKIRSTKFDLSTVD